MMIWACALAWPAIASWTWWIVLIWQAFFLSSWLLDSFPRYHRSLSCASSRFVEGVLSRGGMRWAPEVLWSHPSLAASNLCWLVLRPWDWSPGWPFCKDICLKIHFSVWKTFVFSLPSRPWVSWDRSYIFLCVTLPYMQLLCITVQTRWLCL